MSGVAVFRTAWRYPTGDGSAHQYREGVAKYGYEQQGRWFPEPVAAALVALASLAPDVVTELSRTSGDPFIAGHFEDALDALDAARAQETPAATIHPPAHYQIDTSTPGWNTRYVDAVAKEHGWTRAEAQGRIADGGAG